MVEVICDTSFLIQLATTRIKNLSNIEAEIGRVQFVVPDTVISELDKLAESDEKKNYRKHYFGVCKIIQEN